VVYTASRDRKTEHWRMRVLSPPHCSYTSETDL